MARAKKWKGFGDENLAQLGLEDFAKLVKSRMRRTLKRMGKNPNYKNLVEKVAKLKARNSQAVIKTRLRDALVLPSWLGLTFGVHNGKEYKNVAITIEKVGRRLGEYVHTTRNVIHSGPGVGATRSSKFIPLK